MACAYRVQLFNRPDGSAGTTCPHHHVTLKGAQRCLTVARAAGCAGGIQLRLAPGEPWKYVNPRFEKEEN